MATSAANTVNEIYYIGILRNDKKPPTELVAEKDVSSFGFMLRGSIGELMTFTTKTVAERTGPGIRQDVEEGNKFQVHAYGHSRGICGIIVTDSTFKRLDAQQCLSKVVDEFNTMNPDLNASSFKSPPLRQYMTDWKTPKGRNSIAELQQNLDDTKIILHKTIESILERGEKIDSLVAKSDGLSAQSKMFYTTAKKQNSCCLVM